MQTVQSVLASSCSVFEDAAGGVCFRGSVLGDQRATAFDGAKLDLLRAGADTFFPRFGRFDGQSFGWFKPDIPFETSAGFSNKPQCRRATASGGSAVAPGFTASRLR